MRRLRGFRDGNICQIFASVLLASLSFSACKNASGTDAGSTGGTGSSPVVVTAPISKSLVIGMEGGEITADDGSWKITVPQFALRFPQEIKVTVDAVPVGTIGAEFKKVSKVFKFEPEGLIFEQPAKFWFKYDQGDMAENGLQERMVGIYYVNNDSSLERTTSLVNTTLNEATSELKHFSFGIGLTIQILLVNVGIITNQNPVLNIANNVIAHFAGLTTSPTPLQEYQNNQALIDAFIAKTEQILGYNPLFQAFPSIFPPGTTGGYTLTYDANGASSGTTPTDATKYAVGANAPVSGNTGGLALTNFTFAGWNTAADGSGTTYVAAASYTMPASHVTLYARWVENPKYTITYFGNGSAGGTVPLDAGQYYSGTSVLVAFNTGGLYKSAELFSGWNTQADGNGTPYAPGQSLTMGSVNLNLYATWQPRFTRMAGAATKATRGQGVTVDKDGNLFAVGYTEGNLNGQTINGTRDGFLVKYNRSGTIQWTRLIGAATKQANALGVVTDTAGNIYIAGATTGSLDSIPVSGSQDTYLMKYDTNGTRLWTRFLGVAGASTFPFLGSILTIDTSGNLYLSGQTNGNLSGQTKAGLYDSFVAKYASDGTLNWVRLSGVAGTNTNGYGIAADTTGNVFSVGAAAGNLDGQTKTGTTDAYLMKYDPNGVKQWTRLTGAVGVSTTTLDVKVDRSGNAYVAGSSSVNIDGQIKTGTTDAMVIKFDAAGVRQWTRLRGVAAAGANAVALTIDPFDQIYLCGATDGNLDGQIKTGTSDTFLAKYDNTGTWKYTRLIGGPGPGTSPFSCASDNSGNITVAGYTKGNLDGQLLTGTEDFFVTNNIMDSSSNVANTVTYNGNGHTSGTVPVDSGSYVHGALVLAKPNTGNLARVTDVFEGWNTAANGSGTSRLPGQAFSMGPANETLYANWRQKDIRRLGVSAASTAVMGLATDISDNVISVGYTGGDLDGITKVGTGDMLIFKHDKNGAKLWGKLIGSPARNTMATSVISPGSYGDIYVVGATTGSLFGQTSYGIRDGLVSSFSPTGLHQWTRQFGVPGVNTQAIRIASDDSLNLYVVGYTEGNLHDELRTGIYDGFISKYDRFGTRIWTLLVGEAGANTVITGVATDENQIYVVGHTNGNLHGEVNPGRYSAFVSAYTFSGARQWTRIAGGVNWFGERSNTIGSGIARRNCGGVYITGRTDGTLGVSGLDVIPGITTKGFVKGYSTSGNAYAADLVLPWSNGSGQAILCDKSGGLHVAMQYSALSYSGFGVSGYWNLVAYAPGEVSSSDRYRFLGADSKVTTASDIAIDSRGVKYWSGYTTGLVGYPLIGSGDGFITNTLNK